MWIGDLFAHNVFFNPLINILNALNIEPRGDNITSFPEAAHRYGYKDWDVCAMFIFGLPCIMTPVIFYRLFNGLGNKVSEFIRQYLELCHLMTGMTISKCLNCIKHYGVAQVLLSHT